MTDVYNSDQLPLVDEGNFVAADSYVQSGNVDNVFGISDNYTRGASWDVSMRKIRENPHMGQFGAWCDDPENFDKDVDRGKEIALARSNPRTRTTSDFSTEDFASGIGQLEGSNVKFRFADFEEHRELVDRVIKECQLRDYDNDEILEEVLSTIAEVKAKGILKKGDKSSEITPRESVKSRVLAAMNAPSQPVVPTNSVASAAVETPVVPAGSGNDLVDKLVSALTNLSIQNPPLREVPPPSPVDSLSLPNISAFAPARPTVPVVFHYGEQGDWQHRYHAVLDWGASIVAVFDTRWEEGSQYAPAPGKFLQLSVPSLGTERRWCMVSPVRGSLGTLEVFTFYLTKPPESEVKVPKTDSRDQSDSLAGTSIGELLKGGN